ncbi:hypothetical protein [Xanthomonas sp. NCPPB 2632]|uniref:hypothetical protein n=1 Tax=Xanthomonas sp. NCPPB 2632 TaxID=3240912 RepID=UPI003514D20C
MRFPIPLAMLVACLIAQAATARDLGVTPLTGEQRDDVASYYDNGSQMLKALAYPDAYNNLRMLAFGGNRNGPTIDGKSYVSLHAYGFIEDHGGYLAKWEIKDTNGGPLCGIQPLTSLVDVIDAGDGNALVVVPYWIDCDGLDPATVKLITVYKDTKYAIRGNLPRQPGDESTRVPGDNFKALPEAVQKTAMAYYDKVEAAAKKASGWTDPEASR